MRDEIDEAPDGILERRDRSFGCLAQERLQLREGHFDGIEVWAVGWKVEQRRAGRLDHLAHLRPFVAGEIVHDHDVALRQFGDEHLADIGLEGVAVDRTIDDEGRDEAPERERADEGRRFPMMGWTPPDGIDVPEWRCCEPSRGGVRD